MMRSKNVGDERQDISPFAMMILFVRMAVCHKGLFLVTARLRRRRGGGEEEEVKNKLDVVVAVLSFWPRCVAVTGMSTEERFLVSSPFRLIITSRVAADGGWEA
jgi:hypothetical protein